MWPWRKRREIDLEATYIMVQGKPQPILMTGQPLSPGQIERIQDLFKPK